MVFIGLICSHGEPSHFFSFLLPQQPPFFFGYAFVTIIDDDLLTYKTKA